MSTICEFSFPFAGPNERKTERRTDRTVACEAQPLTRTDLYLAIGISLVALAIYLVTLAPGLLMNDSGELQTLAATLGHTHPTGYPVYLIIGKLLASVIPADVAYSMNLLSAIMAAVTVAGVYLFGRLLCGRRLLPLAGAAALAISPTFWSQAIIAEVYTSGTACMVAVLLCLALWQKSERASWLFSAAFAGGLSLGVHATVSLMAPAALVFLLVSRKSMRLNVSVAAAGALAGILVTALAFWIVDRSDPPSNYFSAVVEPSRSAWGLESADLDSLPDRLRFSLGAQQFRNQIFSQPLENVGRQFVNYLKNLPNELSVVWLLAAAVGCFALAKCNKAQAWLLGITFVMHLVYDVNYDMGDIQVLFIPTYVVLAILGICGLAAALEPIERYIASGDKPFRFAKHAEAAATVAILVWTASPLLAASSWTDEHRRAVWVPEGEPPFRVEYSDELRAQLRRIIADLEDNAVVFTEWGFLYPYYYVAHVEQQRTNMLFVQSRPATDQSDLSHSAIDYIAAKLRTNPVYVSELLPSIVQHFDTARVERGGVVLYRVLSPKRDGQDPRPTRATDSTRPE